ncbi:MAG: circadian clock KaiB family protein [Burkholderiaceae bacterium]
MSARHPAFKFRLYVAGDSLNSSQALANLRALCGAARLPNRHAIDIVDVFSDPARALADGVFMTPTLIKLAPSPARRVVGNLSQTALVREVLGLERPDE